MAKDTKERINFLCPAATVKIIEELAKADHRDKSSMMNKIVDFYIQTHTTNGQSPAVLGEAKQVKKAGAR